VVPQICELTDIQTERQTGMLIAILRCPTDKLIIVIINFVSQYCNAATWCAWSIDIWMLRRHFYMNSSRSIPDIFTIIIHSSVYGISKQRVCWRFVNCAPWITYRKVFLYHNIIYSLFRKLWLLDNFAYGLYFGVYCILFFSVFSLYHSVVKKVAHWRQIKIPAKIDKCTTKCRSKQTIAVGIGNLYSPRMVAHNNIYTLCLKKNKTPNSCP